MMQQNSIALKYLNCGSVHKKKEERPVRYVFIKVIVTETEQIVRPNTSS